eukprot:5570648-Prymnesium_polylepis.1
MALCATVYVLRAPVHALVAPGALVTSPAAAAGAWQRMHVGGAHLARVTLDAPVDAPLPMLGLSFFAATLLSQFFEHSAWNVAHFLVHALIHAARRAFGASGRAVR